MWLKMCLHYVGNLHGRARQRFLRAMGWGICSTSYSETLANLRKLLFGEGMICCFTFFVTDSLSVFFSQVLHGNNLCFKFF